MSLLVNLRRSHGESFYRQGCEKFFCVLDLQHRSSQMCCQKAAV